MLYEVTNTDCALIDTGACDRLINSTFNKITSKSWIHVYEGGPKNKHIGLSVDEEK